jgi:exodeoxyribonuclease-3
MKIITWNVNGLRAIEKKGELDNLIKKYSPDIVCLQETKSEIEQLEDNTKDKEGYYSFFESAKNRKGYSGVATYTKIHPEKVIGSPLTKILDNEGRTLITEFTNFYLLNIYFPNGGKSEEHFHYKLKYYKEILSLCRNLENPPSHKASAGQGKPVIFCGDINTAVEEIDLANPKQNRDHVGFKDIEREHIREFKKYFLDIWREMNPEKVEYTWWAAITKARERNVGWRIDYFFISKSLEKKVRQIKILGDQYGSDHCPVFLEIDL